MAETSESHVSSGLKTFDSFKAFDNKQAAQETSAEFDARHARAICLSVVGNETSVAGGSVVLESAPFEGYTGIWKTIATVTVGAGKRVSAATAFEDDDGLPARVVRARIATQISNGSIDAYVQMSK